MKRQTRDNESELEQMVNTAEKPKILTIDIETSPIVAYTWGPKWETSLIEVTEHGQILSYSAKWLNGKQVTKGQCDYKGYKAGVLDDTKIVADIHKLLDEAHILVTQNGDDFDIRYINARFLKHHMLPPSPYKSVDTKKEARKITRMPSHALDDMGVYFDLGHKMKHEGFELWKACMAGDKKAWSKMKKYNAKDVQLTEQVYLRLRPYMKSHPNLGSFSEDAVCGRCGSYEVQHRGYARTLSSVYQRLQCNSCGGWSRAQKREHGIKVLPNAQ
jgi:DNA polymerase elongation subunit (family B)